jgi:hypothetical protein
MGNFEVESRLMFIASILLFIASSHAPTAQASETDAFTVRYTAIADSTALLDAEMNRRLNVAMNDANQEIRTSTTTCDSSRLMKALSQQLHRAIYGRLEGWIRNHPEIPHALVPLEGSVYREIRWWENLPVHLGTVGFGPVLRINGHLVGNDKIGHFLDEGLHNFEKSQEIKADPKSSEDPVLAAIAFGDETEKGVYGIKATGVYSYADTVANLNGMSFWMRLTGKPLFGQGESYFACDQGKWKRKAEFTFKDYVDAGWDEGMNCSEYRDEGYRTRVMNEIQRLEQNDPEHRRFACPVVPNICSTLAAKYGEYASGVLNPSCL